MFEKLKEYSIFIILSIFGMLLLLLMYYQYSNSKSGEDMRNALEVSISEGNGLSQTLKNNVTIVDSLIKLSGKSLGKYKLNSNRIIFYNVNGEDLISNGVNNNLILEFQLSPDETTELKLLELYMIPEKKISGIRDSGVEGEGYILERKKIDGGMYKEFDELMKVNEEARGFLKKGYLGFGTFTTRKDAEEFIKDFVTTGTVLKMKENQYGIFFHFNA